MKILLFANTDWYLYNFRSSLALSLRDAGHDVVLLSPVGDYCDRLRDMGLKWVEAPMSRRSINIFREFYILLWLAIFVRTQKIDVIHGFTIKCAVYGGLVSRFSSSIYSVGSVAGMGFVFISNSFLAKILRVVVKFLFRFSLDHAKSHLIVQNNDDDKFFKINSLVRENRISVIYGSGVNCSKFKLRDFRDKNNNCLNVLLPARLLWDKGIAEYVESARFLKKKYSVNFLIAGDLDFDNPSAVSEEKIVGWVNEGVVNWLGHVDNMVDLYCSVDIVVLPSYREGLPKGLIEAGACGLPLVTTDVPGCREVVSDGVDGLLVPPKNWKLLADAIAKLLDNYDLRLSLGMAARSKVLSMFDEKIVIKKTTDLYLRGLDT